MTFTRRSIASLLFAVAVSAVPTLCADELTTLDGQKVSGTITAINDAGQITGRDLPADLNLDALRRIDRPVKAATARPDVVLELMGGGRVHGTSVTIENDKFHVAWPHGEKLVLPIETVRAVRLRPGMPDAGFDAALAKPSADNDRLFVEIEGKLTILTGLVESLSAESVVFQYEGAQQTLPLARLYGIVVAQVAAAANATSGVTVELADGSRFVGTAESLTDGKLGLKMGSTPLSVPWTAVKSLSIRSGRLVFLSDLEPIEVNEYELVGPRYAWRRDQSVLDKPLTLGERQYARGIGVHAYSKLVFDIAGDYDAFNAVIGIDGADDRPGDCVFVVLADGREVARQRMTAKSEPKELKLDIAGAKQLALIVEPGEGLDLGDVANWADARVIKQK